MNSDHTSLRDALPANGASAGAEPVRGTSAEAAQPALPDLAVSVKGLSKTYKASGKTGEKHALKSVDLDIPRGSLFGLLGPNGAGKSTLINILAGLVNKDPVRHRP